jgi:hypothetical protein
VRLGAATRDPATRDPATLKPASTWYLATSRSLREASPAQVYARERLRDCIAHFYKPATHERGWADYQVRPERASGRHWQLVLLAYTCSWLVGALPTTALAASPSPTAAATGGEKIGPRPSPRVRGAARLERHAAARPPVALPVGTPAAVVDALVARQPTA